MTSIDWARVDWWRLPGPCRFLDRAIDRISADDGGIVGLSLPTRRPDGLMAALAQNLESERGLRAVVIDAVKLDRSRSPAHALAAAAGASPGVIRSTADFVDAEDLADMIFLIDGIAPADWSSWSLFFRSFRAERLRAGRLTAPSLAVVAPHSLPPAEIAAVLGTDQVRWRGVVSRADMQLFVESTLGRAEGLAERTAVATIVETACWDPEMVEHLAGRPIEDRIDPRAMLVDARLRFDTPSWSNGLVDVLDGAPHVHTLALLDPEQGELLARRMWRAHVGTIFPTIEQVRQTFVQRYFAKLASHLPFTRTFHQSERTYSHPLELEINDVLYYLRRDIPEREAALLQDFKSLRTSMAHMEPASASLVVRASKAWDAHLRDGEAMGSVFAWDWPRCGQRLVLLVGPSGAGKTTYAAARHAGEKVLSSDAIREDLYGSRDMGGSQERVFATMRDMAKSLLSSGQSVVIDATNLRRLDRLANADLVPRDIAVEYVLIDRPMAEKERDAGWRAAKPGLLAAHSRLLETELADILAGDGLPNVTVTDRRSRQVAD